MSLVRVYNLAKNRGKSMINLRFVSSLYLQGNTLKFIKSIEKDSIAGNFLFFGGGSSSTETITFDRSVDAEKEFENICKILENYETK